MPKGKYKRTINQRKKMSESHSGKKLSLNHKLNIGLSHKGKIQSIETRKKIGISNSKSQKGKKLSIVHKKNISSAHLKSGLKPPVIKGEKNHLWKGGITPLVKIIRQCFKMRQWRSDIFSRDDFICQDCGMRGGILNAHHIKRFSIILKENNIKTLEDALMCEELWNINNGKTLCKKCHNKIPINENR
jgi:hypothetical protein